MHKTQNISYHKYQLFSMKIPVDMRVDIRQEKALNHVDQ